jgi:hypothetical protein
MSWQLQWFSCCVSPPGSSNGSYLAASTAIGKASQNDLCRSLP